MLWLEISALGIHADCSAPSMQVGGYLAMNLTMPTVLSWVLGGNVSAFEGSDRNPYCTISERPKEFHEQVPDCNGLAALTVYGCSTHCVASASCEPSLL